jgi:cysteine synthase
VEAHYRTTGPEIWEQTEGRVKYFFAGFGTCGTITGVARYLKEQNPDVRIIGVEPGTREHRLSGMKRITDLPEDLAPRILDRSLIDEIVSVSDQDAYQTGVLLARRSAVLVGPTTGAVLHAALQRGRDASGIAVVISPDNASKYMSAYTDFMASQQQAVPCRL